MKKRITTIAVVLLLLLFCVQTSLSVPKIHSDPELTEVTVANSETHLLLFGMLQNGFTDSMIKGLHSGIPIHFTFYIHLEPEEKRNHDIEPLSLKTSHIIQYDTLKESYNVEIEESGKRLFTFRTLSEAKKAAVELNGMKIIKLEQLQANISYTIKVRAKLYKRTLPLGLHEILPFMSWWDVKTKWKDVTFKI